jgi:hypothetical protein
MTNQNFGQQEIGLHITRISAVWQFSHRTPEDGHLWPKHVMSDQNNSFIVDGIVILCTLNGTGCLNTELNSLFQAFKNLISWIC